MSAARAKRPSGWHWQLERRYFEQALIDAVDCGAMSAALADAFRRLGFSREVMVCHANVLRGAKRKSDPVDEAEALLRQLMNPNQE